MPENKDDIDLEGRALHHAALHNAAASNRVDIARAAIEQGIEVNGKDNRGRTLLHVAAHSNSFAVVRLLVDADGLQVATLGKPGYQPIEHPADIEAKDDNGSTPLHVALNMWNLDVARLLIDAGANTEGIKRPTHWKEELDDRLKEELDLDGWDLYRAAKENRVYIAGALIVRGSDIEGNNQFGTTPLHIAAVSVSDNVAHLLIELGADIEAKSNHGQTPLHVAAHSYSVSRLLIEKYEDIDVKDNNGRTPLHFAASVYSLDVAQLLIDAGANTEGIDRSWTEEQHHESGESPLHWAAGNGVASLNLALLLIEHGADVNGGHNVAEVFDKIPREEQESLCPWYLGGCNGSKPLIEAAQSNSLAVARLLLEHDVNIEATDHYGRTALYYAAEYDFFDVARLLKNNGANTYGIDLSLMDEQEDPENKDDTGLVEWDLYRAARENRVDIASTLIDHGANIKAKNQFGTTPLHYAARANSIEMANLLLDQLATVEVKNNDGYTPLSDAVWKNSLDVARLLIQSGANTDGIDLSWMN